MAGMVRQDVQVPGPLLASAETSFLQGKKVVLLLVLLLGGYIADRASSLIKPQGQTDSCLRVSPVFLKSLELWTETGLGARNHLLS